MSSKMLKSAVAVALVGGLLAGAAQAYEAGQWLARVGAYGVFPESDNLTLAPGVNVDVDDGYSLGFNFTYMVNPNIGIELLAALPFTHDISLTGQGKIGDTKHLPPTLSIQYHLMPQGTVHPYIGLGLNYTNFFSESSRLGSLKLDNSWGLAGQLGIDIDVAPNWFVNADLRYISIKSDATLNGVGIGTVDINPWVVGLTVGTRF
jgi:outer membrane protein